MTISPIKYEWSFISKWHTYDNEDGSASNAVVCPECAPKFEADPSARPLQDQTPDPTLLCVVCDKPWVIVDSESQQVKELKDRVAQLLSHGNMLEEWLVELAGPDTNGMDEWEAINNWRFLTQCLRRNK